MRRRLVALCSLLAAFSIPLRAQKLDLAAFDRYVDQAVKTWGVPGLAISIVKDDSVVFAKGYGVRRMGGTDRVDAHTLFAIGSTTKAMTSLSLLMLRDEKKVDLEDPVIQYLPTLQLYDPVMTRELTVRDLLTHHTGLPGVDQLWTGGDYDAPEIFRRLKFLKPWASFRNRYAYQNVQYAMAGAVIGAAGGSPWADVVQRRIFTPLGMKETVPTLAATKTMPNVASPHMKIDDTLRVIENRAVDPVAPAGSVWSSVSDMAQWMRFVLDSGRVGGKRLVSERGFVDWLSPQIVVPRGDFYPTAALSRPHQINYGLGWFLQDYAGDAVAMHTGSIDGMVAIIGLIPDRRLGVYVLANSDHAEVRHALMYRVFDMYAGRAPRDWSTELRQLYGNMEKGAAGAQAAFIASRVQGTKPALALGEYAGTYGDSLNGTVRVDNAGNALRVSWGKGFGAPLEHWHYDTFIAHWEDRRLGRDAVNFVLDASGKVSSVRMGGMEFARVR
ncbi:MAG: serine hydrolase [Gemmatimonadaceae bacterium]